MVLDISSGFLVHVFDQFVDGQRSVGSSAGDVPHFVLHEMVSVGWSD